MRFTLDIAPPRTTAQQKGERLIWTAGGWRILHYEKDSVKRVREMYNKHLEPHKPEKPIEGPVELKIVWRCKGQKSKWKTTRPDLDNMEKLLLDCMTQCGFWLDDAQVCSKGTAKIWSKENGIDIEVRELT